MDKCIDTVEKIQNKRPKAAPDFRKSLEDKSLDAFVIAAPDHWHAPAAILACKAGKHVYVEKPCSHNPHEGEMLVAAARKYDRKVQMGSQRRSWPNIIAAIKEIQDGAIGRPYFAKGWYTNNRPSIGTGKKVEIPSWLNFDLWQGPAPRETYRDNILHYNWHWFWNWGTGEALNNGTHMVDLMRWGLGVDYPTSVRSSGGRYRYQDDWQTPDTQVITWEFPNHTFMEWEARSCNGVDPSNSLDALHFQNFFDGIRKGTPLNAEILIGHQSTLLCQLGNIAVRAGSISFQTDSKTGHIIGNEEAAKYWRRTYEPGWEPVV